MTASSKVRDHHRPHHASWAAASRCRRKKAKDLARFDLAQPPLEQGRHLHRCRRRRLPDPHADPDHALPALPRRSSSRAMSISRSRRSMRSAARIRPGSPIPRARKAEILKAARGQEVSRSTAPRVSARTTRR